jgi:hypothetical protein
VVDRAAVSRAVEECSTQEAGQETADIFNIIRSVWPHFHLKTCFLFSWTTVRFGFFSLSLILYQ